LFAMEQLKSLVKSRARLKPNITRVLDLQPGTSTSSASDSNGLHSNNDAIFNLLQQKPKTI